MVSKASATAQTSFFQSYSSASPTPLGPLHATPDEIMDDGTVRITVGALKKKAEECTAVQLKHWLRNR